MARKLDVHEEMIVRRHFQVNVGLRDVPGTSIVEMCGEWIEDLSMERIAAFVEEWDEYQNRPYHNDG